MNILQGALLVFFGVGLLVVAWRGWGAGEVPAGPNFLSGRFMPSRERNSLLFHLFVVLYLVLGFALVLYGAQILIGTADPLPLR